jgi:glycosyltransferase involved in cell wall biosynthesis
MSPKVSVVIPVYGVEPYLRQALDSVLAQTLKDMEIIIIDDGSKDGCAAIIDEYAARDTRIRAEHRENGGYGKAVNRGMDMAQGEYTAIFEPDDWIEPDMYESLYHIAKQSGAAVVKSDFWIETGNESKAANTFSDFGSVDRNVFPKIDQSIFDKNPSIWSALYCTAFLRTGNIRFLETPGASYQDRSFHFKTLTAAERVFIVHKPYYHYRKNAAGSSVNSGGKVFCVVDEFNEIFRYIAEDRNERSWVESAVYSIMEGVYQWNFERLGKEEGVEFYTAVSGDMRGLLASGKVTSKNMDLWRFRRFIQNACAFEIVPGPKVSVIVPVYNVEKYIRRCLESLVSQTENDFEILCVDDRGTDDSMFIVEEYAAADNRIRILRHDKNRGLSAARNTGLSAARGKYVMFCDSDDWYEPVMVARMYAAIEDSRAGFAMCGIDVEYHGEFPDRLKESDAKYYALPGSGLTKLESGGIKEKCNVSVWNKIFNRRLITYIGLDFPEGLLYEDMYFFHCYVQFSVSACFVEGALYHYTRRQGSIMTETFSYAKNAVHHWDLFEKITGFYESLGIINQDMPYCYHVCQQCVRCLFQYIDTDNIPVEIDRGISRALTFLRDHGLALWFDNPNFILSKYVHRKPVPDLKKSVPPVNKISLLRNKMLAKKALKPAVTVIVPVYNRAPYLPSCMDSILAQSLRNIEVICVDDGSTDESLEILRRYAKDDERVTIVRHPENRGVSAARNSGLQNARGGYIMWCDPDDTYAPGMIRGLYMAMVKNPSAGFAMCGVEMRYEGDFPEWLVQSDVQYYGVPASGFICIDTLLEHINVSLCNKIFKTQTIRDKELKFPEGLVYEDAYFFICYSGFYSDAVFLAEKLYVYRRHQKSIMSTSFDRETGIALVSQHWDIAEQVVYFYIMHQMEIKHIDFLSQMLVEYFAFVYKNCFDLHMRKKILERAKRFILETAKNSSGILCNPEDIVNNFEEIALSAQRPGGGGGVSGVRKRMQSSY